MTYTMSLLRAILNVIRLDIANAEDGPLFGAKVALYKNSVAPTVDSVWADFEEADFTGYARSAAITWADPFNSSETLLPVMTGDAKTFLCTGDPLDNTVYGYLIVSGATPPVVLAVRPLNDPELMAEDGGLIVVPRVGNSATADIPSGDVTAT